MSKEEVNIYFYKVELGLFDTSFPFGSNHFQQNCLLTEVMSVIYEFIVCFFGESMWLLTTSFKKKMSKQRHGRI